jgi:hypothetical protein
MSLVAVSCALISLFGQGIKPAPQMPPELETMGDRPAPFKAFATSPRLIVPFSGFTSYQVNVDGNQQNIVGDAANEPSMCVDPNNPSRIAIGWRQFDNVTSNFRQAGYGYSTNGGLTWTFPGRLQPGNFLSDPVLGARYDGLFYYLTLHDTFFDDIYNSTSAGASWSMIAPADGGDKEWFTIDNSNSTGRGFLYQIWSTAGNNYQGRQFTRSVDGGATWLNPINITNKPYWGTLDVDNAGTLYIGGWSDASGGFRVVRSSNAKNPSITPTFDLSSAVNLGGSILSGSPVNPGGLSGQMWVAVDHSAGNPNPVYALCSVAVNASNPCDVMLAKSVNGGSSWSTPARVNDDASGSGNYHWLGTLGVGPTGRLDMVWNDTRDDSTHATSSLYYAYSLDGGAHFSPNIRVSPSWNQSLGYPNQNKMGDYIAVISNSVGANIAYTATFNSEEDVYFMQIPAPVVVAPISVSAPKSTLTGTVSNLASIDGAYLEALPIHLLRGADNQDMIMDGISPTLSPKAIIFNVLSKDTLTSETETISFFNWNTGLYEDLGIKPTTTTNSYFTLAATGDLTRFVSASGAMRAKLTYAHASGAGARLWDMAVDEAVWNVIP